MRRILSSIFLVLLLGGGIWYFWGSYGSQGDNNIKNEAPPPPPPPITYAARPEIGYLAPDFLLKTLDGQDIRLSDYLGKEVVVNFWTSRCPFCLTELRNYSRLVAENQGRPVIIAVNRGESSAVVDNYFNKYLKPSAIVFVLDQEDKLYGRYRGNNMPESFFVDTSGVIRDHKLGEVTYEEMQKTIKEAFALP